MSRRDIASLAFKLSGLYALLQAARMVGALVFYVQEAYGEGSGLFAAQRPEFVRAQLLVTGAPFLLLLSMGGHVTPLL